MDPTADSSEEPTTDPTPRRPVVSSRFPRGSRKPAAVQAAASIATPVTVPELAEDEVVGEDGAEGMPLVPDDEPTTQFEAEDGAEESEPTLVDLSRDEVLGTGPFAEPLPVTTAMDAEDRIVTAARPARPRRRHRLRHWLLVVLAVLIVLAVLASTLGVALAESYVRSTTNERVSASLSRTFDTRATAAVQDPSVLRSIFRRNEIQELTFEAPDATLTSEDKVLKFTRISGTARSITDPRDAEKTVIGVLDAQAEMDYAQLSRLAGITITHDTGDRVKFDKEVSIFLAKLTITVTARPVLDPATRKIRLEDPQARASQIPIPAGIIQKALEAHEDKLVLPPLNGLLYESLVATDKGAVITVSGRDVLLKDLEQ